MNSINKSNDIYLQTIVDVETWEYEDLEVGISCIDILLSSGKKLRIKGNHGCSGCGNGWVICNYSTEELKKLLIGSIITNVTYKEEEYDVDNDYNDEDDEEYSYRLRHGHYGVYIFCVDKRINLGFSGEDNGYYGLGLWVTVEDGDSNIEDAY